MKLSVFNPIYVVSIIYDDVQRENPHLNVANVRHIVLA